MVSKKVLSSSTSNTVFMPGDLEGGGGGLEPNGHLDFAVLQTSLAR
jgi:hypothetical protein